MSETEIIGLPHKLFDVSSLDDFVRHQVVAECWRNVDDAWKLLHIAFTEE